MNHVLSSARLVLWTLVLPLLLTVSLSGCTLFGLGAAAGAVVGGCALLDENEDETVTEAELARGLFNDWNTDDDDSLTEEEFDAGIGQREIFADWSDDFDAWDADNDDAITEAEFESGVNRSELSEEWLDDQCDGLGL